MYVEKNVYGKVCVPVVERVLVMAPCQDFSLKVNIVCVKYKNIYFEYFWIILNKLM